MTKGMMWAIEWQRIYFYELGVPLKLFERASADFYDTFYDQLFKKYSTFDELPASWREPKVEIAKTIENLIPSNVDVLSYGCGLGFVEREISSKRKDIRFDAFDFAQTASKWLKNDVKDVTFITQFDSSKKYDFVYMAQLLYALSNSEIIQLASVLKEKLKPNGRILTIDTSFNPDENGVEEQYFLKNKLKRLVYPIYLPIFKRGKVQFWGWERSNSCVSHLIEKGGLRRVRAFPSVRHSFQLFE